MSKGIWGKDLDLNTIDAYLEECSISDDFLYPQYQITLLLNDYKEKIKEIERLNNKVEELMTLYTTEREVKEDYKSIIKEVREYIRMLESNCDIADYQAQKLFQILDKGGE